MNTVSRLQWIGPQRKDIISNPNSRSCDALSQGLFLSGWRSSQGRFTNSTSNGIPQVQPLRAS